MNQTFTKALCLAAVFCSAANATVPFIRTRSEALRAGRLNAGLENSINRYGQENVYGEFSVTIGGGQSFDSDDITQAFFGKDLRSPKGNDDDCANVLTFAGSGSTPAANGTTNWLSDYTSTSTVLSATVSFSPKRTSFFADFDLYMGLEEWACGMWARVHAPLAYAKTKLGTKLSGGDVLSYFQGEDVDANQEPLAYALWADDCTKTSKWGLADIHVDLGWNFISCQDYHMGIGVHFVGPTGNRVRGEYLFEPVVGNGRHIELGALFTGHMNLWNCDQNDSSVGLYVDANVTHMFRARQTRSFDLVGKPNSRYAVAAALGNQPRILAPIANLTAQGVDVKVNVQADFAARFVYMCGAFSWATGYNLWATSCEKICSNAKCPSRIAQGEQWTIGNGTIHTENTLTSGVALTTADIDLAGTKAISHTGFSHMNYTWEPAGECCWGYFVGAGYEIEFAQQSKDEDCKVLLTGCKDSCERSGVSQWSVWAKLGLTF